jgi:2-polyprenyl-3-methyl-5-hydroxy-6-metoxy-1,4-benzoquinol methylase
MPNNTDSMWEKWGKSDPYYAVVSSDKFRAENLSQFKDAFFATGRSRITGVLNDLEQSFGPASRLSALDFGCGVGRLLVPLAGHFEHVDGMDVSASMLEEASASLSERGIANVELLNSDDRLTSILNKTYDLVHSHMVFQHIPKKRGYALLDKLLSHVAPDGCFYIHVPITRMASPIQRAAYFIKHHVPFAYIGFNLLDRKDLLTPTMQMNFYDFRMLLRIFQGHGFDNVAFRTEVHAVRAGACLTASFYSRKTKRADQIA